MHFVAVLNRDGGTLRTTDLGAFGDALSQTLGKAGHRVDIEVVSGKELIAALDRGASGNADVLMAGGGDGTVSAAAARLMGKQKALAVLPAGTMNLFARSLGIPLALQAAVAAFATGELRAVDMASANGKPFVHQFSIGMHAKMVGLRETMKFASRLGKIRASARAALGTLLDPPAINVTLTVGEAEILTRTSNIGVSNNLFGEGHLPYADNPAGGVLGVYVTVARQRGELARLFLDLARGKWRENDQIEIHQAEHVTLRLRPPRKALKCVIDGELERLETETVLRIHPGALRVLVPAREEKKA